MARASFSRKAINSTTIAGRTVKTTSISVTSTPKHGGGSDDKLNPYARKRGKLPKEVLEKAEKAKKQTSISANPAGKGGAASLGDTLSLLKVSATGLSSKTAYLTGIKTADVGLQAYLKNYLQ